MNRLVFLLGIAGFVVVAVMRVTDPLLPIVAAEFAVTVGVAGTIVTAYAVPYGLFQLAYGPLGDRHGKLRVIALTLGCSAFCIVGSAYAASLSALTVWRFLTGLTMAATIPLSMAYIADNVAYEGRQAAIGRYLSGLVLGQIVGGGLAGILADRLGWRPVFGSLGVLTALIAWAVMVEARQRPVAVPGARPARLRYRDLLRDPKARDVLLAVGLEGMCVFGSLAYMGAMLRARFDLSLTMIGVCLIGFGLGGLLYSVAVRFLVATLAQRGMVVFGGVAMGHGLIVLAIAPVWWWAIPLLTLMGFGFYMMHNTLQTLATELAPGARGTAVALFAFTMFAGQGLGVLLIGQVIDRSDYLAAFAGAGTMIGLLGLWLQSSPCVSRER